MSASPNPYQLETRLIGVSAPVRHPTAVRVVALVAMYVLYLFAYFQRTGVPGTIFNELQRDFSLSASAVTGLGAVFVYIYAGMQLVVGMAADRYGGRPVLLFGGLFMCLGAVLFPMAHSVPLLFLSRILIGFGTAFVYLSIVKEIDTLFDARHFASLLGLTIMIGYLGNLTSTLPLERASHAFGWRTAMMAVAVMSTAALVAVAVALRKFRDPPPSHGRPPMRMLLDVLRNRRCRPLMVYALTLFPILFVVQSVLGKKFLQDVGGLSSPAAAAVILAMAAVSGASALCGGWALKLTRQRRKPLLALSAGLCVLSLLLLLAGVLVGGSGAVLLVAYTLMACTVLGIAASTSTIREINRPGTVAVAVSVLNGTTYVGVGIVGNLAGGILDLFGGAVTETPSGPVTIYPTTAYVTLFAVLTALAATSLLVTLFGVHETHGRPMTDEAFDGPVLSGAPGR